MDPAMVDALDRCVDLEIQRTGRMVSRVDIIRAAVTAYLTTALPPQAAQGKAARRRKKA
jgi:hypothetical protein